MPDFFIIGAPKCGTSALYEYLCHHPKIFLPSNKEPHFYSSDMYTRETGLVRRISDRVVYKSLFERALPRQITGEGSTWYLYSKRAIAEILADTPDARFIVMLRNPTDMAQSLHKHHVRKLYDDVDNFETAWNLNDSRARGEYLPRYCPDPKMLHYLRVCSFAPMLRRLFATVPREQVLLHIYEEFFADPRQGYLKTLEFLNLQDDGRTAFERINPHRELKIKWAYELAVYKPFPINLIYPYAKRFANLLGMNLGKMLFKKNVTIKPRAPISTKMRAHLRSAFSSDVAQTEELLGRRIEAWH